MQLKVKDSVRIKTFYVKNLIVTNKDGNLYQISQISNKPNILNQTTNFYIEPTDQSFLTGLFYLKILNCLYVLASKLYTLRCTTKEGYAFNIYLDKKEMKSLLKNDEIIVRKQVPKNNLTMLKDYEPVEIRDNIELVDFDANHNKKSIKLYYGKNMYSNNNITITEEQKNNKLV